jgi:hypothetical protein
VKSRTSFSPRFFRTAEANSPTTVLAPRLATREPYAPGAGQAVIARGLKARTDHIITECLQHVVKLTMVLRLVCFSGVDAS